MSLEEKLAQYIDLSQKLTDYYEIYELQENLAELRRQSNIKDTILFCQHSPTINFGRLKEFNSFSEQFLNELRKQGQYEDLEKLAVEHLSRLGIKFVVSKRGGGSAYIGPGQIVIYPIVNFTKISDSKNKNWYQNKIDKIMQEVLFSYGIDAKIVEDKRIGREGRKDVWYQDDSGKSHKLGGKGVVFKYGLKEPVAYHGFTLNVTPKSTLGCKYINLCGYPPEELGAISIEEIFGKKVNISEVKNKLIDSIKKHFGYSNIVETKLGEVINYAQA